MRNLLIMISGIVALIFCGCSREYMVDGGLPKGGEHLQMSIRVPSLTNNGTVTRADGIAFEDGENTVSSLHLLFFTPAAEGNGEYIGYMEVPMPDKGTVDPADDVFEMNIDTSVDLTGTSFSVANAYHILALANISQDFYVNGSVESWMSQWADKKENEVMATARAVLPTGFTSNSLLMHGRMEKPAGEDQLHLLLERDVVRFDVINTVKTEYDLLSVSIWNGYTATSIWETGIMDYSSAQNRTRFHYTLNNGSNILEGTDMLDDIRGGLYAFENQVLEPKSHDNLTTCLIVQLRDRATSKSAGYYRVNIVSNATGSQALRRNNVYTVNITGTTGPGADNEETAYLGKSNKLIYTIGGWNMDDNGLIVRDEYSILSIPTKTVTIGKEAKDIELSVHTFSTLTSPEPLTIRSQTYRPVGDNIQAKLDGNTLVISAKALGLAEEERSGLIVLSYAGLEISLNVIQSGVHDDYLHVTLPDGGIPQFVAYPGVPSGLITVQATGPWTAKLYQEGFSFNSSTTTNPVEVMTSTDNLVVNDPADRTTKKFRVYTHSYNTTDRTRKAFIMITLDKDPKTHSAVVYLSQANTKKIYIKLPSDDPNPNVPGRETASTTFDGAGKLTTGNFDKFFVISGRNANNEIIPFDGQLRMNGLTDDTGFFEIVKINNHTSSLAENYVTVKAKGTNTTGRELRATLRVYTDPGTFADITLVQQPLSFRLNPAIVTSSVPASGGNSEAIEVVTDAPAKWKATIEMISGTSSDGRSRRLVKHTATLVDEAGNPLVEGTEYPSSTKFRVKFPKIYFPNRDISVQAQVTVTVGTQTKTILLRQTKLDWRVVKVYTNSNGGFGSLYPDKPNYNDAIRTYTKGINLSQPAHYFISGKFPDNGYMLHRTNGENMPWTHTNNFIRNNDGVFWLTADYKNHISYLNGFASEFGWSFAGGAGGGTGMWNRVPNSTKVYEFLTERVPVPSYTFGGNDGIETHATKIPGSATIIIRTPNGSGRVVIDPKTRVVYTGESQTCGHLDNGVFLRVWYYAAFTAKYGSAFSDLLVEEKDGGMPAPWSSYWDDRTNGGTDNRVLMFDHNMR